MNYLTNTLTELKIMKADYKNNHVMQNYFVLKWVVAFIIYLHNKFKSEVKFMRGIAGYSLLYL
jgi:hypothetical protein